jgi:hypothetical protein
MVMETIAGEVLKKSKLLFDSVAWIEGLHPNNRALVLDFIRKDQLTDKGVDEDGDIIGLYSRATELMSGGRKKEGDPFDLNDTGAFYQSMSATPVSDGLIIDGATQKMEDSFSQTNGYWWHDGILGLTDENMDKLATLMAEEYRKYARRTMGID